MTFPPPSPGREASPASVTSPHKRRRSTSPEKRRDMSSPQISSAATLDQEDSSSDELALDTDSRDNISQDQEPSRKRARMSKMNAAGGHMHTASGASTSRDRVGTNGDNGDDPVADAYVPLSSNELQDSESWVDLESDENMFNAILEKLGILGLEVVPIFSLEANEVAAQTRDTELHGVIACVPTYNNEDDPTNVENPDQNGLWFARQHWGLACGTIALLHVLMNQDEVYIGDILLDFLNNTQDRDKYTKGFMLDQHRLIRAAHNMFSTRYEHLQIAHYLNEDSQINPHRLFRKVKAKGKGKAKRAISKQNKLTHNTGYHFIAYIPHQNHLWALDGLKENPRRVGPIVDGINWWQGAIAEIWSRWAQTGACTILGVVANRLQPAQKALAQIAYSFTLFKHTYAYSILRQAHPDLEGIPVDVDDPESLGRAGLSLRFVHTQGPSMSAEDLRKAQGNFLDGEDPYEWYSGLCREAVIRQSEFHNKYEDNQNSRESVEAQLEQWGPALHLWINKLIATNPEGFRNLVLANQKASGQMQDGRN